MIRPVLGSRASIGSVLGSGRGGAAAQWLFRLAFGVSVTVRESFGCERNFQRNATAQPVRYASWIHAKFIRPLAERLPLAVEGDVVIRSRVIGLSFFRCPDAILWRVWAIVVDTFERVSGVWPLSHIRKEGGKIISPSFANGYAAPAVMGERSLVWVRAACNHAAPNFVFRRMGQSMNGIALAGYFRRETPAAFGAPTGYGVVLGDKSIPALALPFPLSAATGRATGISDNGKPKQLFATMVNNAFVGQWRCINCVHSVIITPELATLQGAL